MCSQWRCVLSTCARRYNLPAMLNFPIHISERLFPTRMSCFALAVLLSVFSASIFRATESSLKDSMEKVLVEEGLTGVAWCNPPIPNCIQK